jgi:PII-like signaling protein
LAGATVIKGRMSFGANSKVHSSKILALSDDLPMIIEIVDNEEKINDFIPIVDKLFEKSKSGGLITMEKVEVIRYKPAK